MYCKKCWYVLDGLDENRCPECGRAFDPANGRTYRRITRRRWWLIVSRRTAVVFLVLLAISVCWLYRGNVTEWRAKAKIVALGLFAPEFWAASLRPTERRRRRIRPMRPQGPLASGTTGFRETGYAWN